MSVEKNFEIAIRHLRSTYPALTKIQANHFLLNFLGQNHEKSYDLLNALDKLLRETYNCQICNQLSETPICQICNSVKRQQAKALCIVETSLDIAHFYSHKGTFFVLGSIYDPINGKIIDDQVKQKLTDLLKQGFNEVIIALPVNANVAPTVELLLHMARKAGIENITRITMGLTYGSSISNIDPYSIDYSFINRININHD